MAQPEIPNLKDNKDLLGVIEEKLLGRAEAVTSRPSELEAFLTQSAEETKAAAEKRATGITAGFERQRIEARTTGAETLTTARELQRGVGPASAFALMDKITTSTEKSVRDLDLREKEALAVGAMEDARELRGLKMQAIQFKQNAEQQQFSNLLGIGQFLSQQQAQDTAKQQFQQTLEQQKAQFSFQQSSKIADIATQFGVSVLPTDTLESIVTKVQPIASAKVKAELAKLLKDTDGEKTVIQATSLLSDYITGKTTGTEESPDSAAFRVAADMVAATGNKVSEKQLQGLIDQANKLSQQYKVEKDKAAANTAGNSFWDVLGSVVGKFQSTVLGESPERIEFSRLDRKFRDGESMTDQEKNKYFEYVQKTNLF